jgi:methionine-rich copper-binding protein CopC
MQKNRLILLLAIIAAVGLIAACGLFGPDEIGLVAGGGYINGYVETQDGAPLEGVTVNYSIPDEPAGEEEGDGEAEAEAFAAKGTEFVVTDAAGFFEINGLIPGDYRLTFTISGYTIGTDVVRLTPEGFFIVSDSGEDSKDGSEPAKYEYTDEIIMTLYAKVATASGSVYIETANGTSPATGQTVVAMFQDRFFDDATVDANGSFSFSGLPAGPVAFYARSFYNGTVFYNNFWLTVEEVWVESDGGDWVEVLGTADLSDRNEALGPLTWSAADGTTPFVTSSNLSQSFDVTSSIELTFNKAISPSAADFELGEDDGEGGFADNPLDIAVSWNGNTVTLNPDEVLLANTVYLVTYSVEATDGYTGAASLPTFQTERGIMKIGSNVEIFDDKTVDDFDVTSDITLTFNKTIDHFSDANITLVDDDGNFIYIMPSSAAEVLTINPSQSLEDNMDYTVSWKVYSSLDNGTDFDSGSISFSTAEAPLAQPDDVTGFDLVNTAFLADWNTQEVDFEWNRAQDANGDYVDGYRIYATDTYNGVEEVLVGEADDKGPTDYSSTVTGTAYLNDAGSTPLAVNVFDAWPDATGDVQPFAQLNAITFTVYAYVTDSSEEDILMSSTAASYGPVEDETAPTINTPAVLCTSGPSDGATAIPADNAPEEEEIWTLTYTITEPITNDVVNDVVASGTFGGAPATNPSIAKTIAEPQTLVITLTYDGTDDVTTDGDTLSISVRDTSNNQGNITFNFD